MIDLTGVQSFSILIDDVTKLITADGKTVKFASSFKPIWISSGSPVSEITKMQHELQDYKQKASRLRKYLKRNQPELLRYVNRIGL